MDGRKDLQLTREERTVSLEKTIGPCDNIVVTPYSPIGFDPGIL